MGVTWETRKIMDLPDLPVSCTCVRIPTLRAHGESITIETEKKIDMDRVYAVLNEASGVVVVDDTSKNLYPMPITASTKFDVEGGRRPAAPRRGTQRGPDRRGRHVNRHVELRVLARTVPAMELMDAGKTLSGIVRAYSETDRTTG